MDRCHGMKDYPIGYPWSKYDCFLATGCQDIDSYKTLTKWNGNGNAYDRGDYNSSFALRAIELKMHVLINVYFLLSDNGISRTSSFHIIVCILFYLQNLALSLS